MSDFLSSPFVLVAAGLVVLAVAIVLLVAWIVTLDRRMRDLVDGLELERRKVAEMQMVIGRRNVSRGYGHPHGQRHPGMDPRAQRPAQAAAGGQAAAAGKVPAAGRAYAAGRMPATNQAPAAGRAPSYANAVQQQRPQRDQHAAQQMRSQRVPSQQAQAAAAAARGGFDAAGEALRHQQPSAGNEALIAEAKAHAADPAVRAHSADEDMRRAAERAARQQRIAARRQAMQKAQAEADRRYPRAGSDAVSRSNAGAGAGKHAGPATESDAQ